MSHSTSAAKSRKVDRRPSVSGVASNCGETVEHTVEAPFPPTLDTPGFVQIGETSYRVEFLGSDDLLRFSKPDGTFYECRLFGDGKCHCDCPDFTYRSKRGSAVCKHGNCGHLLRAELLAHT